MPVPKKRMSRSRRDMRRAHDFLTPTYSIVCPNCGSVMMRHRVCGACGHYRGREIISKSKDTVGSSNNAAGLTE